MRILTPSTLREFWENNPRSRNALSSWIDVVEKAEWKTPADVLAAFGKADAVGDNRVVFNIRNNEFRLIVHFKYKAQIAMMCFIGTHADYDRIDAESV